MYQDAYNTLMQFFKSGLIQMISFSEDGKIQIMPKEKIVLIEFDSIENLLIWFEDNEL